MNLRFKQIDIENFRSIARAVVDLENQGTVIVKGINEYEDKATSNGSGKSSKLAHINSSHLSSSIILGVPLYSLNSK